MSLIFLFKLTFRISSQCVQQKNIKDYEITFPGVLEGDDPSALLPRHNLSFCLPVFSRFLLLKSCNVAPPTAISCLGQETSHTYKLN